MSVTDLTTDPVLVNAPVHEGYKVLGGVVLYQKLGQGGMGAVYRGKHLRLEVDVALKVMATPAGLHPDQAANYLQRFLREAKTAASVKHSNLIRVYDVNSEGDVHFLIMDFVDGESAGDRLKRKGRLTEREAVEIALGAAEGLAAAHEAGIVHRDVKPDNILIDKKGNTVVADLGLAKAYGAGQSDSAMSMGLSLTQQAMGTPYYMAPEQTMSAKDVGPAADVWSLGVTLYQLATNTLPWSDSDIVNLMVKIRGGPVPDVRQVCPGLSDGLCAIIDKTLSKAPDERYANCVEMAATLSDHLDAIGASRKSVLPDAEAGKTKVALVSATPPPSKTLTLIGKTLLKPAESERPATRRPADTFATVPAEARAMVRGGLPGWVMPVVAAGVVLMGLILWAVLGLGREKVQTDPIEAQALRFLGRVTAVADDGRLEEAAKLIDEAGTRYDATAAGPKIAHLAETVSARLATKKRQEEEKERARREKEKTFAEAVDRADRAEKAGDLEKALRSLQDALELRDVASLRERASRLERALAARRLIEEGIALEKAGEFDEARSAYEKAIPDAVADDRSRAEERLAEVTKRIHIEEALADIRKKVETRRWREAWDSVKAAREAGLGEARLDDLARQVVKALAPPETLPGPLGIELVLIRDGLFRMGSDTGKPTEAPAHEVTVDPFYVGRFEVTCAQFDAFRQGRRNVADGAAAEGQLPAVGMSWADANAFCGYLSGIDEKKAVRLPTEAEWEFAARGPEGREFPWGDEEPEAEHGNIAGDADGHAGPAPVGSFPKGATPLGIFGLAGNAAEWCADWYGLYRADPQTNPVGPTSGKARVVRGGAFALEKAYLRGAARAGRRPDHPGDFIGFRVVRELTAEESEFYKRVHE